MTRVAEYRATLKEIDDWIPFLLSESRLPGPRANLELLAAVADEGDTSQFLRMVERPVDQAPSGTPGEFVVTCGAVGLGERIARGEESLWPKLRALANDSRWRVREGVAMGLQRIGCRDMRYLMREVRGWVGGSPLERRAVAAGLCEPRLLRNREEAIAVLGVLDEVTQSLEGETSRGSEEVRALRKALGYCWSVVVVAVPEDGKKRFVRWVEHGNTDVQWVVRENLRKKRLRRMDELWVGELWERIRERAGGTSG